MPIAWLPFFQHPDPTVKRASGFLAPVFEMDKDTGFGLTVPYYWVIDDQRDATIYARYTERRGPVLAGEYRQVWDHARLKLFGSITEDIYQSGGGNTDDIRGHLFANFRQDINDTWRAGFDIQRASDRYYLRQYDYGSANYLTSRAYAEAFWRRSYFAAEAYNFQQMRPQVSGKDTPYFVPRVRLNYIGDPLPWGGHFIAETNTRTVLREQDVQAAARRQSSFRLSQALAKTGPSPSAALARREDRERVVEALGELSEDDREILLLRLVEQLSTKETAAVLGIAEGRFFLPDEERRGR